MFFYNTSIQKLDNQIRNWTFVYFRGNHSNILLINYNYRIIFFQFWGKIRIFLNFIFSIIILTTSRRCAVGTTAPVIMKELHMTTGASYRQTSLVAKGVVIARWAMYLVTLLAKLYQPCHLLIYHVLPIKQRWRMYLPTRAARNGPAAIFRHNCQVNSSLIKIHISQHPSQPSVLNS